MNYKSQLRGWAVDRVIELKKANGSADGVVMTLGGLTALADQLAEYAYVAREDLDNTAKDLFELVRNAPANESSVDALIGTLEHIKMDRLSQGIDKDETKAETVQ